MAPEQSLGRGMAGRRRGGSGQDAGVTAVFKVDDSSLKKLNDLWGQLVKNVKAFNAELKGIDARKLNAVVSATGRVTKATGAGGGGSTITAGGFSNPPGQGNYPGPLHPGYPPRPPGGGGGGGGGGGSQHPQVTPLRAALGVGGAIVAYGGAHKQNMIDAERLAQYSSWSSTGRSEQLNAQIRDQWFGSQPKGQQGLTGGQNTADYLRGIATLQGTLGYNMGPTNFAHYQSAGRMGNLLGSFEQGARVQAGLQTTGSYYGLMPLGINTANAKPEDIANQFISRVYQGRMPTSQELAIGQRQGMSLRTSMEAYGLDPEMQEAIIKYGMTRAKLGEATGLTGQDLERRMREELTVTGGKTKEGKSVFGATAYDAQRGFGQRSAEAEQRIADSALPAMRESFEAMTTLMDNGVIPALESFMGTLLGVGAGGGAALAGPAAALSSLGGGILPSLMMAALWGRGRGGGGPGGGGGGGRGPGGGGLAGAGRPLLRAAGFLGAGFLGGQVAGGVSDSMGGPDALGSALRWGGTGAGIGAMVGGPWGAAIGGAAGGVFGAGKSFLEGLGGAQDSGSQEEVDVFSAALAGGTTFGAGTSTPAPASSSAASPTAPDGANVGGVTARGAKALAWMMAQSRNPSQSWLNYCLKAVRSAFGVPGGVKNATTAWYATKKRHGGTPPPGVPVWWTGGDGHVALSAGGGYVWSNDILRKGQIDKVPISLINRKWNKPYQGWSEDINGVDVYDPTTGGGTAAGGTGRTLTASGAADVFKLARDAGFNRAAAVIMTAIAGGESGFKAGAHNPNRATGDNSYGLWQINMLGDLGPERRRAFGLTSNEELFDPRVNARAAWAISNHGRTFTPWSAYKNGSYRRYLTAAQAAAASLPSYDQGSYEIDRDHVALVHRGEMVLPAKQAGRVRDAVKRRQMQPSGGHQVHVHITAHLHMNSGVTQADAERFLDMVARAAEQDHRLASVMVGD